MKTKFAVLGLVVAILCGLVVPEVKAAGVNHRRGNVVKQGNVYSRGYAGYSSYGYARGNAPRNNYYYAPGGYMDGYGGRGLWVNPYMYTGYAEGKMGFSRLH